MSVILSELLDFSSIMEELGDPRTINLPYVPSPYGLLAILLLYVGFVTKWGPNIMKNRKPFDLKYAMIAYDALQVLVNAYLMIQGIVYGFIKERYSLICQPIDFSDEPNSVWIAQLTTFFFLVKVLDLTDTIFMVLRKKANQLGFLQVYHHSLMAFGAWLSAAFFPGGHMVIIGVINCFVHAIMYFYYLLGATNPVFKQYVWFKKHLTKLQMIQLSYFILHCAIGVLNPFCNINKKAICFGMVQNIIMLNLFWEFYKKVYFRKTEESLERNIEKKINSEKIA